MLWRMIVLKFGFAKENDDLAGPLANKSDNKLEALFTFYSHSVNRQSVDEQNISSNLWELILQLSLSYPRFLQMGLKRRFFVL